MTFNILGNGRCAIKRARSVFIRNSGDWGVDPVSNRADKVNFSQMGNDVTSDGEISEAEEWRLKIVE